MDTFRLKASAYIVTTPEELPRALASEFKDEMNPSFMWIAGRFVQANKLNKNGMMWTTEDLEKGEHTVKYVPLNVGHNYEKPVGVFVETKLVNRETADTGEKNAEIQALSVLWAANFPELANVVRMAHQAKQLHFSMECVAEAKQCLTCDEMFPWVAQAHETCSHLAESKKAPRRFVNPIFVGGALVLPPDQPAWSDAEITDLSGMLAATITPATWEKMMASVVE